MISRRPPTLFRKKTGYYYALFYDRDRTPSRKWVPLALTNKRLAEQQLARLGAAYLAGDVDPWCSAPAPTPPSAASFEDTVAAYLDDRTDDGMRPRTRAAREAFFERFAAETLPPEARVEDVTPAHIDRFVNRQHLPTSKRVLSTGRPQPLTDTTRATYHAQLRAFFRWTHERGLTPTNPAALVRRVRPKRKAVAFLTPAQFEALTRVVFSHTSRRTSRTDGQRLVDVFRFAAVTGLRLGELCALRWSHIDRPGRLLRVASDEHHRTKTDEERIVPLAAPAVDILDRLHASRTTPAGDREANERSDGHVFRSAYEEALSAESTSRSFRRYRRMADLPEGVTFHTLRKTCGVVLANAGVDPFTIQKILGHASVEMTARVYSDVLDRRRLSEMDRAWDEYRHHEEHRQHSVNTAAI